MGRVLVVGGFGTELVDALAGRGAEPVLLQTAGATTDAQRAAAAEVVEVADLNDRAAVAAACARVHAGHRLDAVVSLSEFGLAPAAALASDLGLPTFHSEATTNALRDKSVMRAMLARAGRDVEFRRVTSSAEAARAAIEIGFPVVVKPCSSWGSLAVRRADSVEEVTAAAAVVLEVSAGVLVERFLHGPEYSVEAFSTAGEHRVVAVTGKSVLPSFLEIGHVVPAPLAPDELARIEAATGALLDVVGVRDGPTHTEVIRTAEGVLPVESHTRVGGDRITELVRLATGVDLWDWSAAWVLGTPPPPGVPAHRAAAIAFLHAEPGAVEAVRGVAAATAAPGVVEVDVAVRPGDVVRPLAHSFDRCGHVIAVGDDAAQAQDRAERASRLVAVRTDAGRRASEAELRSQRLRYAAGQR